MTGRVGAVLFVGLSVVIPGCLTPRTDSGPIHTYQISLETWSREAAAERTNDRGPVLLVSPPQPDPGFDTPRMVFLKRRYELEYYSFNQWADTPARMLTSLLVETLSRDRRWRAVAPMPSSIRGDYRLDTYGLVVQQEFFQQPSRTRVTGRMQLVDLKNQRIVGTRTFEAVEDAPSEDAYGGVVAANRAVAKWLDLITIWTTGCMTNGRDCSS